MESVFRFYIRTILRATSDDDKIILSYYHHSSGLVTRRSWVRIPPEPLNFSVIQLVIISVGYHHWEVQLPQDAKLGKDPNFGVISEIQRAKISGICHLYFWRQNLGLQQEFQRQILGQAPRPPNIYGSINWVMYASFVLKKPRVLFEPFLHTRPLNFWLC